MPTHVLLIGTVLQILVSMELAQPVVTQQLANSVMALPVLLMLTVIHRHVRTVFVYLAIIWLLVKDNIVIIHNVLEILIV